MTWLGQGHWDWFPTHELAQRLFFHFAIWDTIQYYAVCNKTLLGPFLKHWQAPMGHKPNAQDKSICWKAKKPIVSRSKWTLHRRTSEPHLVGGFLPVDKKTTKWHLEASLHMTWLGQGHLDWLPTHEIAQRLFFHFAIWDTIQQGVCYFQKIFYKTFTSSTRYLLLKMRSYSKICCFCPLSQPKIQTWHFHLFHCGSGQNI